MVTLKLPVSFCPNIYLGRYLFIEEVCVKPLDRRVADPVTEVDPYRLVQAHNPKLYHQQMPFTIPTE